MGFDLVIRGATVTTSQASEVADIGIIGGKITEIGDLNGRSAKEAIEARGLAVLPGVIDTQVHFREPGFEHKEDLATGTLAALFGGVTSILEMPNTNPATVDAASLQQKIDLAEGRVWCHYGFFVGATNDNIDELAGYEALPGTPGIKIFMGSSTGSLLVATDENLRRVLRNGKKRCPIHAEDEPRNVERKSLISDHPHAREHPFLRDAESACLATRRILALSEETGRPVHILHVSTVQEPALISEAKRKGLRTTAEVTPQHLFFAAPDCYERLGTLAQMNPPIRDSSHREGLWRALDKGIFDVFGSDHAPHTLEEKALPYPKSPSGMPGVQTMLSVLLTFVAQGRLSLRTVVKMACEKPAELYGIANKGQIAAGCDADLTLVDTKRSYRFERSMVKSKCGWSPYEGEQFVGAVEQVILAGSPVLRSGELLQPPLGRRLTFT